MRLRHARWQMIRPALKLLEDISGKPLLAHGNAEHMLLAIGLQESAFKYRHQIKGPARGYWQFEKFGGLAGVMRHSSSGAYALALLEELNIGTTIDDAWEALPWSELLQAGFARLLLWTDPHPLPAPVMPDTGWNYYMRNWRPGLPHQDRWAANWRLSCELCEDLA